MFTLKVDAIMVAGSPGMRVQHASELGIGAEHVYSQEAGGDQVPAPGRYGHGGIGWSGRQFIVPSDEEFGGHRLATDGSGHSDYWSDMTPIGDKDSDPYSFGRASRSLDQQARVVAGTPGDGDPTNDPRLHGTGSPGEQGDKWWQILF